MDIREYTYFLAVAENKNITKAAKQLYISQPSLSIFIKKLEDRVGFPLFYRTGTSIELTNEGRVYEEYARQITQLSRELDKYFHDLGSLAVGSLKIGVTANRGPLILNLLPIIYERLPNINIELVEGSSEDLEEQLVLHKLDFALLNIPFKNYELDSIHLIEEEVVVGIPFAFEIESKMRRIPDSNYPWIDVAELKDYPFVLNTNGQRLRQISDFLFLSKEVTPKVYMESGSMHNLAIAMSQGIGIGFLIDSYIKTCNLTDSNIRFCSVGVNSATKLQYVIAFPKGGYLSAPAKECISILEDVFSDIFSSQQSDK